MKSNTLLQDGLISLGGSLALGLITALASPGSLVIGWAGAGLLSLLSLFALLRAWRWAGVSRGLLVLIGLAFLLRFGLGLYLRLALPEWGYPEPSQQAGYFFIDDYRRDTQAWELAQSGAPLGSAFGSEFVSDQYGGLLGLSALLYRTLSPDAHRPLLVLILGAFTAALGLPFFFKAVRARWNARTAWIGAAVLALYPDGIVFASSQMREPFLIGLSAVAIWAVLSWKSAGWKKWAVLGAALAGMALFSFRAALPVGAFLAVWLWIEEFAPRLPARWRWLAVVGFLAAAGLVLLATWQWLQSASAWDMLVTERSSGRVQAIVKELGDRWRVPFLIVFGVTQPVLPAALIDPSLPIHQTIMILRSAGWYLLVPALLASACLVWKVPAPRERRVILWVIAFVLFWTVVSAARAGGDQWDNPRYRSILLVWLALLAGWTWDFVLTRKDPWLARWFVVEAIFLGFFGEWYISRYLKIWGRLPFWQMVVWIVGLGAAVIVGSLAWDFYTARKRRPQA